MIIEHNGEKFKLNIDKAIKSGILVKIPRRIGNLYKSVSGYFYVLAMVQSHKVCLISIVDGNRWVEPVMVQNYFDISSQEWDQIRGGDQFEMVELEITEKTVKPS